MAALALALQSTTTTASLGLAGTAVQTQTTWNPALHNIVDFVCRMWYPKSICKMASGVVADYGVTAFAFVRGFFVDDSKTGGGATAVGAGRGATGGGGRAVGARVDAGVVSLSIGSVAVHDVTKSVRTALTVAEDPHHADERRPSHDAVASLVGGLEELLSSQHGVITAHLTQQGHHLAALEQGQRGLHEQLVMLRRLTEQGFDQVLDKMGKASAEEYQTAVQKVLTLWEKATKFHRKGGSADKAKNVLETLLGKASSLTSRTEVKLNNLAYSGAGASGGRSATVGLQRVPYFMSLLMAKRAEWDASLMLDPHEDLSDDMKEFAQRLSDEARLLVKHSSQTTMFDVAMRLSRPLAQYAAMRSVLLVQAAGIRAFPVFGTASGMEGGGGGDDDVTLAVPSEQQPLYWDDGLGELRWLLQHSESVRTTGDACVAMEPKEAHACTSEPFTILKQRDHDWFRAWQRVEEDDYEYVVRNVSVAMLLGQLGVPDSSLCGPADTLQERRELLRALVLHGYQKAAEATLNSYFGWEGPAELAFQRDNAAAQQAVAAAAAAAAATKQQEEAAQKQREKAAAAAAAAKKQEEAVAAAAVAVAAKKKQAAAAAAICTL